MCILIFSKPTINKFTWFRLHFHCHKGYYNCTLCYRLFIICVYEKMCFKDWKQNLNILKTLKRNRNLIEKVLFEYMEKHAYGVIIDRVCIDDRIYWTPLNTARDYTLHFTITHILMSIVTSSLPLFGSGFQRQTFPYLWDPELSLACYQLLTATAHKTWTLESSKSLTKQQTPLTNSTSLTNSSLTCSDYNISARTAQKTPSLCCCTIVAFVSFGFPTWSLLSHCLATAVVCGAIT
jgi:hypothetical protein